MISIIKRNHFPHRIETIFIEIFLTKAKPMTLDVIYRPPSPPNFLETINKHFNRLDTINKKPI